VSPSRPSPHIYTLSLHDALPFSNLEAASDEFKILCDNAYIVHHLTHELIEISNILEKCKKTNYPDRVVMFTSTSKMTFPGSGMRSEEHTSELHTRLDLVCRLLLQ